MTTRSQPWQEFGLSQRWSDKKRTAGSRYATDSAYSFPVRNKSSGAQSSAPVFYEATYKYNKKIGAELAILSGGLNNMLMMIAQLLTVSCADPNGVLLLPPMDIDPLRALMQDKIHESPAALRTRKNRGGYQLHPLHPRRRRQGRSWADSKISSTFLTSSPTPLNSAGLGLTTAARALSCGRASRPQALTSCRCL